MTLVADRAGSHAQQPPVPAPQAPGQAPGGGRGEPRNIQVLKDVPQDQMKFIPINADLAKKWPSITKRKPAPADADEWKDKKDKLDQLIR